MDGNGLFEVPNLQSRLLGVEDFGLLSIQVIRNYS